MGLEGSQWNLYEYANGHPLGVADPYGELLTECALTGAAADAVIIEPTDMAAPVKIPAWAIVIAGAAAIDAVADWWWNDDDDKSCWDHYVD